MSVAFTILGVFLFCTGILGAGFAISFHANKKRNLASAGGLLGCLSFIFVLSGAVLLWNAGTVTSASSATKHHHKSTHAAKYSPSLQGYVLGTRLVTAKANYVATTASLLASSNFDPRAFDYTYVKAAATYYNEGIVGTLADIIGADSPTIREKLVPGGYFIARYTISVLGYKKFVCLEYPTGTSSWKVVPKKCK